MRDARESSIQEFSERSEPFCGMVCDSTGIYIINLWFRENRTRLRAGSELMRWSVLGPQRWSMRETRGVSPKIEVLWVIFYG